MTERERIERFEAAYNRIDKALEEAAGRDKGGRRRTYAARVRSAANRMRRIGKHVDFLLEIGELRNAIVHNRTGDGHYIAIPLEETVTRLEEIERSLFAPERVVPKFQCAVRTVDADDSLSDVADAIRTTGFTRFPVYRSGSFLGLLTSDGLVREFAGKVTGGRLEVQLGEVRVADALEVDRRRERTAFVSRETPVDDVEVLFRENPRLEAVIITEHGRLTEKPMGLITPSSVLRTAAV